MFANRVLDHGLVRRNHERSSLRKHEESDRFERFDRRVGQATIEIVNQHDQPIDRGLVEKLVERFLKLLNVLRDVLGSRRIHGALEPIQRVHDIVFRDQLRRIVE